MQYTKINFNGTLAQFIARLGKHTQNTTLSLLRQRAHLSDVNGKSLNYAIVDTSTRTDGTHDYFVTLMNETDRPF